MPTGDALISGASIAGLSAAFWLERAGWRVTLIERAAEFRDGGQNVDVRGEARQVADRMGLTDAIRAKTTTEEGTRFVDEEGDAVGGFPAEEGEDGPTAELEILRGDLARLIRDALGPDVVVRFGQTIASVDDSQPGGAEVRLDSGETLSADLVVIAEGVRSATRGRVFGGDVEQKELKLAMVYGTIERAADDDRWWNWYTATGKPQVTLRPDPVGTTRATLAYLSDDDHLTDATAPERIDILRRVFEGAGWQTERVLDGFANSEDVYVDYLTQIRMPSWSKGRVCVTGDAAWCVTPLALIGGYVLAASLSNGRDLEAGLAAYEKWMRPVLDGTQSLPPGVPRIAYPDSPFGVAVQRLGMRVASSGPVRRIAARALGSAALAKEPLPELRSV